MTIKILHRGNPAPVFEAIVVPPQPQTVRVCGFTIRRDNSGPDYAEIKLKKGNEQLAVLHLAKNEIFSWANHVHYFTLDANETVTLESTAQVYIDDVVLEGIATWHKILPESFTIQQPMAQQSLPHGMRIPLPDKYIPSPEPEEKKEPDIDPRIKGLIDSLEEKKKK